MLSGFWIVIFLRILFISCHDSLEMVKYNHIVRHIIPFIEDGA